MKNQIQEQEQLPPKEEETAQAPEESGPEENLMDTLEQEIDAEEETKPGTPVKPEPAAAKPKKKKGEDEDIVEEKTYTIPLSKALLMPPRKRSPRAMRILKAFVVKHMKMQTRPEEEGDEVPKLVVTNEVNECIWGRGIEKPPRKIRVRATKDSEGNVTVHLAEGD
ncbi:MAG: 50S ribosomal protein L31e [Candidatus Bathyarchaeota archaeon]|nr:50S ribosomal protein L31e [Candidatus Bathyarchaeota archaeon]